MTITCSVIESKRAVIPAVTHVDGTARPQVVEFDPNDLYSCILKEFNQITGVPVLVNTSLNVHETPINYNLADSIKCLLDGSIDYIVTDKTLIYKAP
jgi:carbamoyltransferase